MAIVNVSPLSTSFLLSLIIPRVDNRFAAMRLEELQGDILNLCKDQHGCRYLQKKLEEEVPEHRDMIFRETYGHFPELMTGTSSSSRLSDRN